MIDTFDTKLNLISNFPQSEAVKRNAHSSWAGPPSSSFSGEEEVYDVVDTDGGASEEAHEAHSEKEDVSANNETATGTLQLVPEGDGV